MCMNSNLVVKTLLPLLLLPLVSAAQVLPHVEYIDAGGFTGESIAIQSDSQFTRMAWDDVSIRFEEPEPWTYRVGETGTYTISGDTVRLTFKEVILDSTAIANDHGNNPMWTESPGEYSARSIARMNQNRWVVVLKNVGGNIVLWRPTETADLSECERMVMANPDTLNSACYTPQCAGVLWPNPSH